ncbi:MAG: TolC family protein [Paludibacter sp.]|nr:TolC family protein [Paludibacter sp.]
MTKNIKYILLLILFPAITLTAQENQQDSLTFTDIISEVFNNYPTFKKAEKDLVAVDAKIGLAKTAYLPNVDFSSSYSRIGPTSSITMPINGENHTFSLYPENVYNAKVSVNEDIYDFGKTAKNVEFAQKNKDLVLLTVEQAKQQISMAVTANYYSINFLQEAISIKNEQLKTLNEHLQYVQKKANTGSATNYDILTTKVRISEIENQITDLQTSLDVQSAQLNSFLGKPAQSPVLLKKITFSNALIASADSLCNTAYNNRSEMKLAMQKEEIAKSRLAVVKAQNNPSLNVFASGGYKNGYFNENLQDVGKMNFAVGVGLKVPIFDANRSKYSKIQANAELEGNEQETELARRNITNEVIENRANALSAIKKIKRSELQLHQARQAYELAEVNYKAGAITNLDLLDNYTSLAQSKLMFFKAKIDYEVNMQKLKISIGEKIY